MSEQTIGLNSDLAEINYPEGVELGRQFIEGELGVDIFNPYLYGSLRVDFAKGTPIEDLNARRARKAQQQNDAYAKQVESLNRGQIGNLRQVIESDREEDRERRTVTTRRFPWSKPQTVEYNPDTGQPRTINDTPYKATLVGSTDYETAEGDRRSYAILEQYANGHQQIGIGDIDNKTATQAAEALKKLEQSGQKPDSRILETLYQGIKGRPDWVEYATAKLCKQAGIKYIPDDDVQIPDQGTISYQSPTEQIKKEEDNGIYIFGFKVWGK